MNTQNNLGAILIHEWELPQILGVSMAHVKNLRSTGKLRGVKYPKLGWFYDPDDIAEYIAQAAAPSPSYKRVNEVLSDELPTTT